LVSMGIRWFDSLLQSAFPRVILVIFCNADSFHQQICWHS
jgi:hypothetical protein